MWQRNISKHEETLCSKNVDFNASRQTEALEMWTRRRMKKISWTDKCFVTFLIKQY